MNGLEEYKKIVGKEIVDEIYQRAKKISAKHILCINSTYQAGGVAELLNSTVTLFNKLGIKFGWRILHGTPDFFTITKKFHNALHGEQINFSERKRKIYYQTNKRFSSFTHIDHDLVIIHDPQPLPLIDFYPKTQPWIFRCHLDITEPNKEVWNYLKEFIEKYDRLVVSAPNFKKDLKVPQTVIPPAIDPLTNKNKPVEEKEMDRYLAKNGINRDRPIISQVSRFDKWKNPLGVIEIFEKVKQEVDCQLALVGSFAPDDPGGQEIFEQTEQRINQSRYKKDIKLLWIDNDFLVNCLQRASQVVIQKSQKEGFGLTISEALYKGTPVVASEVGGIPWQVIDGVNGFLHQPNDIKGFSESIIKILKDDNLKKSLGEKGKEHIKQNFLITRLLKDWLNLFEKIGLE